MIRDRLDRPIRDLRVSVTDRCDLRCSYCMPDVTYDWLRREEILTFEEIHRLTAAFVRLGVEKVRLTGGEPLLRSDIEQLIAKLRGIEGLREIALTTNASRLAAKAEGLRDAGLDRINVSLDTLDPETFQRITRRDGLAAVIEGLRVAREVGLRPVKLNMVVERGVNENEILPMIDFCHANEYSLRFIEFMDVGNANGWKLSKVVPASEILEIAREKYTIEPRDRITAGETAARFCATPRDATRKRTHGDPSGVSSHDSSADREKAIDLGIIASVTRPFCTNCSRVRVTAAGRVVTCLFSTSGTDVKSILRSDAADTVLDDSLRAIWQGRADRFSEQRLEALRSETYDPTQRAKIEMITLGG